MAVYRDHIYPQLIRILGNPKPIRDIRQRIIPLAHGTVLEIGVGPGVNFVYYDPTRVCKLYALEPNPGMRRLAKRQRRRTPLDVEFLDLPGERIPLADEAVDTVVSTLTLCTVPGVVEAIDGIARVLKPGGTLIFIELGLAPDQHVRRWQVRLAVHINLAARAAGSRSAWPRRQPAHTASSTVGRYYPAYLMRYSLSILLDSPSLCLGVRLFSQKTLLRIPPIN
jgi:SAM-dependent methyltransferase